MSADEALNGTQLDRSLDQAPNALPEQDAVDVALEAAAAAGRFDVVAQVARELEARRLARMGNVVCLPVKARQQTK